MVESPPKLLLSLPVNECFFYWQEKGMVMGWITCPAAVNPQERTKSTAGTLLQGLKVEKPFYLFFLAFLILEETPFRNPKAFGPCLKWQSTRGFLLGLHYCGCKTYWINTKWNILIHLCSLRKGPFKKKFKIVAEEEQEDFPGDASW